MNRTRAALLIVGFIPVLAIVVRTAAAGPAKPDFSGTWAIDLAKSRLQIQAKIESGEFTLDLFGPWHEVVNGFKYRPALVLQDGMTPASIPWDDVSVVFIGASTEWKLGPEAAAIVGEAKRRGCWVHMGRVNTARRILYAKRLGCDSVDGSSFSRFANTHLSWALTVSGQGVLQLREG